MGGRWWTDVSVGGGGVVLRGSGAAQEGCSCGAVSHTVSAAKPAGHAAASHLPTHPPRLPADAPFCKHIFVPNWTGAPVSALPITDDNKHLLQSGAPAGMGMVW